MDGKEIVEREDLDIVKKKDWIWLPHSAHFCGWQECRFRLATVVGDFIVSTIGEYDPFREGIFKEIGGNRFYETMVFLKKETEKDVFDCCGFEIFGEELDAEGTNSPKKALEWHNFFCNKYSRLMVKEKVKLEMCSVCGSRIPRLSLHYKVFSIKNEDCKVVCCMHEGGRGCVMLASEYKKFIR